jgi:integrase
MLKRLTQRVADAAKPADKPYQIHDTAVTGLVLRVQPSGRKIWKLIQDRKPRTLGTMPTWTHAMAAAKADAILRGEDPDEPQRPEPEPEPALTFDKYLDDHYGPHLEAHSANPHEMRQRLDRFKLGDKALDQIRLADVETWRTKRLKAGRKPSTLNRDTNALKAALQRAVDWELIEANPLARLKPLKVDKQPIVRYLSDAEEKRLTRALKARDDAARAARRRTNAHRAKRDLEQLPAIGTYCDNLTPLVLLALNTGLRRGELLGLSWGDVDLRHKRLTVRGEGTKTGQSRHVPLNDTAVEVLKAHRGEVRPLKTLPVFGRHEFKKAWATVLADAQIENFRFHDCRHHFASKLVMAGVPLFTVGKLLGHANTQMTERYSHLAPDALKSAVDLIG